MKYPDHATYRSLYAAYFRRDPADLVDLVDLGPGDRAIDLCCGGGRLTESLLAKGCIVTCVDSEPAMIPAGIRTDPAVMAVDSSVEDFFSDPLVQPESADAIFCQNAVTYWWKRTPLPDIVRALKPGGVLVFNTFAAAPGTEPAPRSYSMDGRRYAEISYLIGDEVHHVQCAEGIPPHTTVFNWIDPAIMAAEMERAGLAVSVRADGKTAILVGVKPE